MADRDLDVLRERIRHFVRERDWEQFHAPKNLASALVVEAAELLEHFQWLTAEQSRCLDEAAMEEIGQEIADVLIYLIRLADVLGVDLVEAAVRKLAVNERKYPAERVRGSARKYTEY
jgi:NTP pyrophosphatase (non-canonical NTP hydrolase)